MGLISVEDGLIEICACVDYRTHLLDILTLVNNKIAAMKGNRMESMIPKIESTFRKKFFFPR